MQATNGLTVEQTLTLVDTAAKANPQDAVAAAKAALAAARKAVADAQAAAKSAKPTKAIGPVAQLSKLLAQNPKLNLKEFAAKATEAGIAAKFATVRTVHYHGRSMLNVLVDLGYSAPVAEPVAEAEEASETANPYGEAAGQPDAVIAA